MFSVIQLLIAFVNILFRQSFPGQNSAFKGLVSVLIPARNEEKNIANILRDLYEQDYQNIEIIVFDDLSVDKTAEIVNKHSKLDNRIRFIKSGGLPDGWLGKNYACYILSKFANGEYLLYLDADVRLKKDVIIKAVTLSEKFKLGLLSIFPVQKMITIGERIAVPAMNYILLSLLPLVLVRKSNYQSLASANGQFMLFNSARYRELSPHKKVKDNKVEDIKIARYFKQKGVKTACIAGNDNIKCRMYESFNEAVDGFSRNIFAFFSNSIIAALLFWIITTFGILAVLLTLDIIMVILFVLIITITRIIISIISNQNILMNLVLFIPQQLAIGCFIYRALINKYKKQHQWKGRKIV